MSEPHDGDGTAAAVPLHPASTVMLLRDGEAGLEVFMLRRHPAQVFAADSYVFPGGRVDDTDSAFGAGLRFEFAAVRECFEEAGVLLATTPDGEWVADGHPVFAHRGDVHAGTVSLAELLATHDLRPGLEHLVWVAQWVTPRAETTRRFDTHFFAVGFPEGQTWGHDHHETVDSEWVRPVAGLQRADSGQFRMLPPTRAMLETLAGYPDVSAAMAWARTVGKPARIQPKLRIDADGRVVGIALPTDPDYHLVDD